MIPKRDLLKMMCELYGLCIRDACLTTKEGNRFPDECWCNVEWLAVDKS